MTHINIKGAKENNLKNISLKIPHNKFVVITGVSGSGKTSLAFDTLYAEGQRRYVESLSSYARLFLGRMKKPKCDSITQLPPAIAIEQKVVSRNPRSTVGTSTEIYDYLRLLFARIGKTYSPISGNIVKKHTTEDVVKSILNLSKDTLLYILSPINISIQKDNLDKYLISKLQNGYTRLFCKDELLKIEDFLSKFEKSKVSEDDIKILIDRLHVDDNSDTLSRMRESIETAFYEGDNECVVYLPSTKESLYFSSRFECDGIKFEEPTENMFSFNSPLGACPTCEGFGNIIGIDEKLVIPNSSLSVFDGCVQCWHGEKMKIWQDEFCRRAAIDSFPIFTPYHELSQKHKDWLWHGLPSDLHHDIDEQVNIDAFFKMVKDNQYKIQYRVMMSRYRGKTLCPRCKGTRLKEETRNVKIDEKTIQDLIEMPISALYKWFKSINLTEEDKNVGKRAITEILSRLSYLENVGLGYLTLNRLSNTLSGGESQRINLTTSLGSSLVGSLYILDEPSIGLHSRDTHKLISIIQQLRDMDNTVIVVEHDEDIMRAADYLIDIGPDAGRYGGNVVFQGDTKMISEATSEQYPLSHTVKYLSKVESIPVPSSRRKWNLNIEIKGARMNNLKGIDVKFPLNVLTVVTGVSGSGKSSLVRGILYPALKRHLNEVCDPPGDYISLEGDWNMIEHVEMVDQNPIGKSSRSNPVTYVKAFDLIRQLFADQPLSKQMGYSPQYFSFNTDGGRCDECKGTGEIYVEMQFMPDLVLECDACHGTRYKRDILDVKFKGKNISEVLDMSVNEAFDFFLENNQEQIANKLKPLKDVGLGYIKLGQSSSSLSGGENQRVKLAYYIGQERQAPTLFIFDEPTTGLHFHDIQKLLGAFNSLIQKGHSIIVIEHNLEVIKCADYIIDLGPDAGVNGGEIVAEGTPEQVANSGKGFTSYYLKEIIS